MSQITETELKKQIRPAWAEVDLSMLGFNLAQVRNQLAQRVKLMPIVKADAYGHGITEVSRYLVSLGIDCLGIATVNEGIYLREKDIGVSLFILGNILPEEVEAVLKYNLIPTICSLEVAERVNYLARQINSRARVHLKIDTGMGRIGVYYKEAFDFFLRLRSLSNLDIEGIWTHFSSSEDIDFTEVQLERFNFVLGGLKELGFKFRYIHSANSTAIFKNKNSHFNLVRPGLVLYGVYPDISLRDIIGLKPVMSLKTRIVFLKKVSRGRSISYGRTFITKRDSLIATLPIGYGDGYGWLLSNRGSVLVRGRRVPIVGRVCMDQTMIDLTDMPGVVLGEEVILIGEQNGERITVEELACLCETIPYEILCGISSRIPRIYKE